MLPDPSKEAIEHPYPLVRQRRAKQGSLKRSIGRMICDAGSPPQPSSICFARDLDTNTAHFTLLTPYPGTDLHEELRGHIAEKNWDKYDGVHAVYRPPRIPRIEL